VGSVLGLRVGRDNVRCDRAMPSLVNEAPDSPATAAEQSATLPALLVAYLLRGLRGPRLGRNRAVPFEVPRQAKDRPQYAERPPGIKIYSR
jgi:hypothetical protein